MKNRYTYIFMMTLFVVFACERVEEVTQPNQEQDVVEKVEMTFGAVIESDDTKTVLVDGENANIKKVLWQPGDAIGISKYNTGAGSGVNKFTTSISEPSSKADFGGITEFASRYRAFYPYSESLADLMGYFYFDMPAVQKYVNGSFDPQASPMVASADPGEDFNFYNLCGILCLNITGTQAVKYITFSGYDEVDRPIALSGRFYVDPESTDPQMTADISHSGTGYSVTLECDVPVQLDPEVPTPFYIMLPPGTYGKFYLTIMPEEGEMMLRSSTKPMVLERSHVMRTGALEYVEATYIDLSETGHANCYMVNEPGAYSFDATVIGNGVYGFFEDAYFHTDFPFISPVFHEVLWMDKTGIVTNVSLEDGRLKFVATGTEGNALIAVKDESERILWSWHIWITDKPMDQTYVNSVGSYVMQDRNLGATRNNRGSGDEWYDARGLKYQWGRKDPILLTDQGPMCDLIRDRATLEQSIQNPTSFYGVGYHQWNSVDNQRLWVSSQKTIYDPCPSGYRVPINGVWRSFTHNEDSYASGDMDLWNVTSFSQEDNGVFFYYDGNNFTYYPSTGSIDRDGNYYYPESMNTYMWTSNDIDRNYAVGFRVYHYSYADCHFNRNETLDRSSANAVRCMKDDGYVDISYSQVEISEFVDVTTSSVNVIASVTYQGSTPVTERGILWGTTSDLTLENALYITKGEGLGEFECHLTDLNSSTRYYVRAYATNSRGTSYSKVKSFRTFWTEGTIQNLSDNGLANCYIVNPISAEYAIDVDVIGNGEAGIMYYPGFHTTNPLLTPSDAELLWEDREGVISDVRYVNGQAAFVVTGLEGNAVIAAKDDSDNIIWSWHIWVTDEPVEQIYNTNQGQRFVVMDRNLGSISAIMGEDGGSLYYQWGRKDPFRLENEELVKIDSSPFLYVSESVSAPTTFPTGGDYWVLNHSDQFWSMSVKTIYDPCPAGWRVPGSEVWSGIRRLIDCDGQAEYAYARGVVFGFSDSDYFWYPDTPRFDSNGTREGSYIDDNTELWTAENGISYFLNYGDNYTQSRSRIDGHPVRCMKE